jgi:hypothetical protein
MTTHPDQNGQSNGSLSYGGADINMASMFSISPQMGSRSNMVTTMMFNPAGDSHVMPVQPPLSDFLSQVNNNHRLKYGERLLHLLFKTPRFVNLLLEIFTCLPNSS